jgi:hypothetical protein
MINSVKQHPYFEYSIEELKPKNTHRAVCNAQGFARLGEALKSFNIDIDELLGEYHAEY